MAVGGAVEVQMVVSDATTDQANPGTSSDQMGVNSKSLTWKPFDKLSNIGECISGDWIKRDQPHPRKKASGVENCSTEGASYGLRYSGLK